MLSVSETVNEAVEEYKEKKASLEEIQAALNYIVSKLSPSEQRSFKALFPNI